MASLLSIPIEPLHYQAETAAKINWHHFDDSIDLVQTNCPISCNSFTVTPIIRDSSIAWDRSFIHPPCRGITTVSLLGWLL